MIKKIKTFLTNVVMRLPFGEKFFTHFRKKLIFYTASSNLSTSPLSSNISVFKAINNFDDFLSITKKIDINLSKELVAERFKNNNNFYLLHDNSEYLSYGWGVSGKASFLVDFFNVIFEFEEGVEILFDFRTNENFRRKGFYKQLLKEIITSKNGFVFIIYTAPVNVGSQRGILSSGFTQVSTYSKFNIKKLKRKLKKQNVYLRIIK